MSFRPLRHLLEYAAYRLLTGTIRLLPHRLIGRFGALVGRAVLLVLRSRRRLTLDNLERIFPELSTKRRLRIARACFAHWGSMFLESISLERYDAEELAQLIEIEGLEHLERARSSGHGLLLTSGHFGAFENITYSPALALDKLHILVRQQNNPWVNRHLTRLRERTGHTLIPRRRAAHRMLNILRRGGSVAIAIDQRVRPTEGVLQPFLGHPAWTSTIPAFLSTVTGAPMLPVVALPLEAGRYKLIFQPPIWPRGRGEEQVVELTRLYLEEIERQILERPEMWFWMHSRWRRCARHRWPTSIERLRRDSQLPPRPAPRSRPSSRDQTLATAIDHDFLELGRHALLAGDGASGDGRSATTLGHALIDSGHPVLYEQAAALASRLVDLGRDGKAATEVRKLDRFDLIIIDHLGAADVGETGQQALSELLEHRSARRSVLSIVTGGGEAASHGLSACLRGQLEKADRLPAAP